MKSLRASSLRLILPLLSRVATLDLSGIAKDDEVVDFVFVTFPVVFVFVPGKERSCAVTVVPSFLSYFLT